MLEEPPEQTLLILTARQSADLLPTIVSRCLHIRFNPVSRPALSGALIQHHGFGADEASIVAALAGGSFSRALSMKKATWMSWRGWLITELSRLGSSPFHVILALSEKLSKNRDALSDVFEIMLSWFRDILIVHLRSANVINRDRLEHVQGSLPALLREAIWFKASMRLNPLRPILRQERISGCLWIIFCCGSGSSRTRGKRDPLTIADCFLL